jgi:hypothetical protein
MLSPRITAPSGIDQHSTLMGRPERVSQQPAIHSGMAGAATGIPESAAIMVHIGVPPVRSLGAVRFF